VDKAPVKNSGVTRPQALVLASDVLFAHFFPEPVRARLSEVADWSRHSKGEDSAFLREKIAQVDVLMTTWHSPFLRANMLGASPRVKLIAHCGGEVKSRVAEELFDYITVTNAADPMAAGVAEMTLALMLSLVRKLPEYAAEMRAGVIRTNEDASEGETVRGRKVGIVGFGRIGKAFASLIKPLGAEVLVADPHCSGDIVSSHAATLTELDELVGSCSVVILAAALTPETRNLFDAKRLALLPYGAYLINVARGGLIDIDSLVTELRTGRITAALDVTDPLEPLPSDHELRRLSNVLLTPHIAAGGIEMRRAIGAIAVEEVVRFSRGEPPLNLVTREMLATMT
jgi:phosphoglycerate dehydrogenase-like enzyme